MKIKKIIDLCKRAGVVLLCEAQEAQWISDGAAAYPLYNMPQLGQGSICAMYDIKSSKAEKMQWRFSDAPPGAGVYDIRDIIDNERECTVPSMAVRYGGGKVMIPMETATGVEWINAAYLAPLDEDGLTIWERRTTDGRPYFAAKNGLELHAIILPLDVIDANMVEDLHRLAAMCKLTLVNRRQESENEQ